MTSNIMAELTASGITVQSSFVSNNCKKTTMLMAGRTKADIPDKTLREFADKLGVILAYTSDVDGPLVTLWTLEIDGIPYHVVLDDDVELPHYAFAAGPESADVTRMLHKLNDICVNVRQRGASAAVSALTAPAQQP